MGLSHSVLAWLVQGEDVPAPGSGAGVLQTLQSSKSLTVREKVINADSGLSKNGAKRSFRHISGVTREGHFPTGPRMTPHFMAARPRTVERIAEMSEAPSNVSICEPDGRTYSRNVGGAEQRLDM